jgi:protein-arginine kinase activator protein McsA
MPNDPDDSLAYKIQLSRLGPGHEILPCDTCRSRPAAFELAWLDNSRPMRGICQHCVDEELDVRQFDTAREMSRLLDAVRTADSEALARRAEFYEDCWKGKEMPAFIAAFVARHLRQPPWNEIIAGGVSLPPATAARDEIAVDAARAALLFLRGALAKHATTRPDVYLLSPPDKALTPADAAAELAAMPKPLICRATERNGYMAVRCVPMLDHDRRDARRTIATRTERIYCLGAGETLMVSQAAIDKAFEDYELNPIGVNSDVPASYLSTHPDAARDAHAKGAEGMMQCTFAPDDWAREDSGQTVVIRNNAWRVEIVLEHAPTLSQPCDLCRQYPAGWRETDVRSSAWIERALCERCAVSIVEPMARRYARSLEALMDKSATQPVDDLEALRRVFRSLSGDERDERMERLKSAAELLERAWLILPMPPFVRDVLARYRSAA